MIRSRGNSHLGSYGSRLTCSSNAISGSIRPGSPLRSLSRVSLVNLSRFFQWKKVTVLVKLNSELKYFKDMNNWMTKMNNTLIKKMFRSSKQNRITIIATAIPMIAYIPAFNVLLRVTLKDLPSFPSELVKWQVNSSPLLLKLEGIVKVKLVLEPSADLLTRPSLISSP